MLRESNKRKLEEKQSNHSKKKWKKEENLLMVDFGLQATMPSSEKHPSHVPMWRGVQIAYVIVAMCLFPLAIGGYWAYGQKVYISSTHFHFSS